MYSLLLMMIYLAFISLGLPDSLIGSGWPVMHTDLAVPLSYAGIVTMIISVGTIISSLLSDRLTRKMGTGLLTAISVLSTAIALFGFSIADSFLLLCLWAIPYGFGAGAVDAALNNYVALHYSSRHMNWLHCMWGIGASISPYIMGYALSNQIGWQSGYQYVGIIQISLTLFLFITLPLWQKRQKSQATTVVKAEPLSFRQLKNIRGLSYVLLSFLAYCALEQTAGLWSATYLTEAKQLDTDSAARFTSFFFLGITIGRFLSGIVAGRFSDRQLIRGGITLSGLGVGLMMIPVSSALPALIGLVVIGLGCAPIYPAIIHSTPDNFGEAHSQAIIGVQMAFAYLGTTFMPPLFGLIANHISVQIFPFFLLIFVVVMLVSTEKLNQAVPHSLRNTNHSLI